MKVCESHASLPSLVQRFFADWLIAQREASPHTVASYRDTFRLLLTYASRQLARQPTDLSVADIDADLVAGFLAFVEDDRKNSIRTRNVRRAAIRGFFRFVAIREPALLLHCQRVLAIPAKRQTKRTVDFLEREEAAALLAMPDLSTSIGRRDRNLLLVALQTGLRVSELIGLNIGDVVFGPSGQPHVRCRGKGRKDRATPLRGDSARALAQWLPERTGAPHEPLFASNRKRRFSRDGIERIVRKYARLASATCPSLAHKRVSPHTLRHSAAMELLQSGVGCTVIALWLGHESAETTHVYLHADMQIKKQAMDRTRPVDVPKGVYRPDDELLAFLNSLLDYVPSSSALRTRNAIVLESSSETENRRPSGRKRGFGAA